jgi:hypothetical protein
LAAENMSKHAFDDPIHVQAALKIRI